MRRFLIGIAAVLGLALVAILVAPSFLDWNAYKSVIAESVREATGRDLRIDGDVDLALLPTPRLSVGGLRLANLSGASTPDMVRLKSLRASVAWSALLEGRIEIDSVTLVEPEIDLEILADGRANWNFAASGANASVGQYGAGSAAGAAPPIRLERLDIERGRISYRDAKGGTAETVEGVNAQVRAESLRGPFQGAGEALLRGVPVGFEVLSGLWADGQDSSFGVSLDVKPVSAKASFKGGFRAGNAIKLTGRLRAEGADLAGLIDAFGQAKVAPPALRQAFSVDAALTVAVGAPVSISVDDIAIQLGDTRGTGAANLTLDTIAHVDVALSVNRLDLDKLLAAPPTAPGPVGGARPPTAAPAAAPAGPLDAGIASSLIVPNGIEAALDLTVDGIEFRRGVVRQLRVNAAITGGTLTINQATAQLPGGSEASLFGVLSKAGDQPRFEGNVEAAADNLRGLLAWLQIDTGGVPQDRLRKLSFASTLRYAPGEVQLAGINLQVDASRLTGGIAVALRQRPAFGADLVVDRLNLDAYLPAPPAGAGTPAPQAPAAAGAPSAPGGFSGLAGRFDANLKARIDNLTVRGEVVQGLVLDGTLQAGVLNLRDLAVRDFAGASGKASGTVGGLDGTAPSAKLQIDVRAADATRLSRLAGHALPAGIGPATVNGRVEGSLQSATVDIDVTAVGGKAKFAGKLGDLATGFRHDIRLEIAHPDTNRLMRAFGQEPPSLALGPLTVAARAEGTVLSTAVDTDLIVAGAKTRIAGTVSGLFPFAPRYTLRLESAHPEVKQLVASLAGRQTAIDGPFALAISVKGTDSQLDVDTMMLRLGPMNAKGTARADLREARPKISMALSGDDLLLEPFLGGALAASAIAGAGRAAGPAPVPAPTARWSREPFDLGFLKEFDGDLKLEANSLSLDRLRMEKPRLDLGLKGGILDLNGLNGVLFGGAFEMKGRADARTALVAQGTAVLTRADIRQALLATGGVNLVGGTLDVSLGLGAGGASPSDLVSSIKGEIRFAAHDGAIEGFDLTAVSDQLKRLDRVSDLLSLIAAGMGGGRTRFSSLSGAFALDRGVATSNDIKFVAQAGEGRATGAIDLPRWTLDLRNEFRLTEHANAPPFFMRLEGPIDSPRRIFETQQLQAFLLQKGFGAVLQRALPQELRQGPAAIIQDLLPGLLGVPRAQPQTEPAPPQRRP
ncbi:MAG: AsmA family protein [Rhodospirillaceae bacterium]|nr:AsmA family protein [Rhodospirillaceae bacterium]